MKIRRKEKSDRILELQEKIRALNEKKPEGNLRQVEREIENIDWKIQTTSLSVKEEQDLVNQVRQLEAHLSVHKQIKKVKEKLFELRTDEKKFGTEAKPFTENFLNWLNKAKKSMNRCLKP